MYTFQYDTQNLAGVLNYTYRLTAMSQFGTSYSSSVTVTIGGLPSEPDIIDIRK